MHRRRDGDRHGGGEPATLTSNPPRAAVAIHAAALAAAVAHAARARPRECCGVLIGRGAEILEAVEARNRSADPNRYELDPADHFAIRRRARASGLAVLGFYHSHPHSPAAPSPADLAEATYPDHFYLIVGEGRHGPDVRLFKLEGETFVETPFATLPD